MNIKGIAVVGTEGAASGGNRRQQRNQRIKIAPHRSFADQQRHPLFDLFHRLRNQVGLVAVADSGGKARIQVPPGNQRTVAVHRLRINQRQFFQHPGIALQQPRDIHHLRQSEAFGMLQVSGERRCVQNSPAAVEFGRGHTAGKLHVKIQHHPLRRPEKVVECRRSGHIRQLVRITDRGGHAVRHHQPVEFIRSDHRGLQMHMRIDKAGNRNHAAPVKLRLAGIAAADSGDPVSGDRNVAPPGFPGGQGVNSGIFNDQVRRFAADRHSHLPCNFISPVIHSPPSIISFSGAKIRSRRNSAYKIHTAGQARDSAGSRPAS